MSGSEEPQELEVEAALAEYMSQCDSGSVPNREEFLSKHPDLREKLEELLNAADWIEELAGPTISDLAFAQNDVPPDIEDTLPHFNTVAARSNEDTHPGVDQRSDKKKIIELSQPVLPCQFGDYLLERILGRGGMGVVYFGRQVHLERPVAIKMIRSGALASEEEVQRFFAEAKSAAKLDHPNIVTVYQCGEQDGHRYFSMDYVEGTDLAKMLEDGPIDPKVAARYVRDAALAIEYAHERGILHRDLKPANVLVSDDDQVHITDFGLAKSIGTETGLTATGAALGTPSYMSPEQAAGKVDEQRSGTDVYSLGAILFALVTGRPPFKTNTAVQTIMQVIHRPAPMVRTIRPDVPSDLETIIDVCLQKSPDRRYESAGKLAEDLDRFISGAPIQARPMPRLRRAWYWLLGIPIFGAVLDNRVIEPTDTHRWVQRGLISIALLMLAAWIGVVAAPVINQYRMPSVVKIAAGLKGGNYDKVATWIGKGLTQNFNCTATPVVTNGSNENIQLLITEQVQVALVQADAFSSDKVKNRLRLIAPLYYEVVHICVRADSNITQLSELKGRKVLVGPESAGSHSIAKLLLQSVDLSFDDFEVDTTEWHALLEGHVADAAILVAKESSEDVSELLESGKYKLIPMEDAHTFSMNYPAFHTQLIGSKHYPKCNIPTNGVWTVAMPACLVATEETPSVLVNAILERLYDPNFAKPFGLIPPHRAPFFPVGIWHLEAEKFYRAYESL